MGLFSRKGAPTKPGRYSTSWPRESGLGTRPYLEEREAQEAYLTYTSERRRSENVPAEDMAVMSASNDLLYRLAGGTPVKEVPLIQGPVDIEWFQPFGSDLYSGEALVTDRRVLVWWESMRARPSSIAIFDHVAMIPRPEQTFSAPYGWHSALYAPLPVDLAKGARRLQPAMLRISVHFSSDGHANRRTASVVETLHELERRVASGVAI
jgi:hypothetical protein